MFSAILMEPSVLSLSATITSPETPCSFRKSWAFLMHPANVRASLRQGITMDNSGCITLHAWRECGSNSQWWLASASAREIAYERDVLERPLTSQHRAM